MRGCRGLAHSPEPRGAREGQKRGDDVVRAAPSKGRMKDKWAGRPLTRLSLWPGSWSEGAWTGRAPAHSILPALPLLLTASSLAACPGTASPNPGPRQKVPYCW